MCQTDFGLADHFHHMVVSPSSESGNPKLRIALSGR
jgi:hypothetical protein